MPHARKKILLHQAINRQVGSALTTMQQESEKKIQKA